MIQTAEQLAESQGVAVSCAALGVPRSSLYEARSQAARPADAEPQPAARPAPPRALSQTEREQVRDLLNSERFQDAAPREVYAELLDGDRQYFCSWRSMYRILAEYHEVRERRNQLRHPAYQKPELLATGPNQVYSWDITKLRGPSKGVYYYLYAMLDIYSRYMVGWMLAEVESELAEQLIAETCAKQGVRREQLTIHADNGSPMIAKSVAVLMADLGVIKSHSRPHVSDDNPFSEAQFKTLKYRPDYPERFGSLADARSWARRFFAWYNDDHHHSGLGLLTPAVVHGGQAESVRQKRQTVLQQAYQAHPERFVKGMPVPAKLPEVVWINPPKDSNAEQPMAIELPAVTETVPM